MKIKMDKKPTKRVATENGVATIENLPKLAAKKAKLSNKSATVDDDVQSLQINTLKTVDTTIFQHFKSLTDIEEQSRLNGSLQLLQQLSKTLDHEKRQKQLGYTLKRLVRGCGASTNVSRVGFYTALVSFLRSFRNNEIPLKQIYETLEKELHVGGTVANKEDADAVVGKILTCQALLNAGRIAQAEDPEDLKNFTKILLQAARYRIYHAGLAYAVLIASFEVLTLAQFEHSVWPLLQLELIKTWSKQTLHTVDCLIAVHIKYPSIITTKFLKQHFGDAELLNAESYKNLYRIYFEHSNTDILTQPAFERFGVYIANKANVTNFWKNAVDVGLQTPTKLLEIISLRILTDILNNFDEKQTTNADINIADLFSSNFMKMFIEGLKNLKQKKDETLQAFYDEFVESIVNCCNKLTSHDAKVTIIKRMLFPPTGAFNIEKFTNTRVIHQIINVLGEKSIMEIFELYKGVFTGTQAKADGETWLNFERLNAGYMLQHLLTHKAVQQAHKWRRTQLLFFLNCGVFHVDEQLQVCKRESAGTFSKEFGEQCKNIFYASLQGKMSDLPQEKKLLLKLNEHCNAQVQQHKHIAKYLRMKNFNEAALTAWHDMQKALNASASKKTATEDDKLQTVFQILLLNMGLQLFREPDMAAPAIGDLIKCMERTDEKQQAKKQQKSAKKKKKIENVSVSDVAEEEPAWIEVVMDLFLHLLSQNASALRNIVNVMFTHLCKNLNLNAVHQILSMLDMKDGHNPLSGKDDLDDDDDEESVEDDENVANEADRVDNNDDANDDDVDSAEDDDEDDEDEDEDDDDDDDDDDDEDELNEHDTENLQHAIEDADDEEVTANEKLRNAVSEALMKSGAAIGANDDDAISVDLNDLTEEEGRKIDEALADAFKAIKKSNGGSGGAQDKKSKSHRVRTTTLMHFRIRVLDLVEIYLQQQPTLLIAIETMLSLYDMLEHCTSVELKPLQQKVEKVINKLTSLKDYIVDEELKQTQIVDFLRLIVDKRTSALAYELTNKLRNKCIVFLIMNGVRIADDAQPILALCQEYVQDFVKSRNPALNITMLTEIMKVRWPGVWELGVALAQQGINAQTRIFRRLQVYDLLAVIYRNNELQKQCASKTAKYLKKLEKPLSAHITALSAATSSTSSSIKTSVKEFKSVLELLLCVQRAHARLNSLATSTLCSAETCEQIQIMRRHLRLDSINVYQRYCSIFKLKVIRNNELQLANGNGHGNNADASSDLEEDAANAEEATAAETETGKLNKLSKIDKLVNGEIKGKTVNATKIQRQHKKQKKIQRMQAVSRGINDEFSFVDATPAESLNNDSDDDV